MVAMIWKKLRKKRTIFSLCLLILFVLVLSLEHRQEEPEGQSEIAILQNIPNAILQNIPIVIFSSYRHEYLAQSVDALRRMSNDINASSMCIFILHQTNNTRIEDMEKTQKIIDEVSFCRVKKWEYKDKVPASSLAYKKLWFKTLKRFFSESLQEAVPYDGDVFILEEDAVLSKDAMKVLWFCRMMKNELGQDIRQVVLGSHAGENLLNPHPNTFVVRKTIYIQPMAYAFNRSLWNIFLLYEKDILNHALDDFTDAASDILSVHFKNNGMSYHIANPTLSRVWHIGKKGIGLFKGKNVEREILPPPSWTTEIDLSKAVVNKGIRDNFGAQCKLEDMVTEKFFEPNCCPGQFDLYLQVYRYKLVNCVKMPFSNDPCMKFDASTNKINAPD